MEIQREFEYRPPTGSLKLLGVLIFILAPITIAAAASGEVKEFTFGRYSAFHVEGPAAPWVMGLFGVLCAVAGYFMLKGARQMDGAVGRIAFLPHSVMISAEKTDSLIGTRYYKDISDIKVSEKRGQGFLTFKHKDTRQIVYSKGMKSLLEFEQMCAELQDRVESAHAAVSA